jgi:hypothetical protein
VRPAVRGRNAVSEMMLKRRMVLEKIKDRIEALSV